MNKTERNELLKSKLSELQAFKSSLSSETLNDFNIVKKEISDLLDDNEKIRFSQIVFYSEKQIISDLESDDLPF